MINLEQSTIEELDAQLKDLATNAVQSDMVRHARIIEAFAILNEKNNRSIKKIERRNTWLTIVVIILTVINLFLVI